MNVSKLPSSKCMALIVVLIISISWTLSYVEQINRLNPQYVHMPIMPSEQLQQTHNSTSQQLQHMEKMYNSTSQQLKQIKRETNGMLNYINSEFKKKEWKIIRNCKKGEAMNSTLKCIFDVFQSSLNGNYDLLTALKQYIKDEKMELRYPKWNGIIKVGADNITCSEDIKNECDLNQRLEENIAAYIIELQEKYPRLNNWDNGWNLYRFGDMFKSKKQRGFSLGKMFHKRNFPTSIISQYMDMTDDDNDYISLRTIIVNRTQSISDPTLLEYISKFNETLIVHLRTGDVLDMRDYSVTEILLRITTSNAAWIKSLKYYQQNIDKLNANYSHIKNILFFTGYTGISVNTGKYKNHHKTIEYIAKILRLFEQNGYNTFLRVNENPDIDLILMCNSKYFLMGGGGFSRLISKMVSINNGTVLQ